MTHPYGSIAEAAGECDPRPLSFTQDEFDPNDLADDSLCDTLNLAMDRNMSERGLCPCCGNTLPDDYDPNELEDFE